MITLLFSLSVLAIIWTYAGYPLSMYFIAKGKKFNHDIGSVWEPQVDVIIAVYKGANEIYAKLLDTFATDYDLDRLKVYVVMDGYCDETYQQVDQFMKDHLAFGERLVLIEVPRGGKEAAQAKAVEVASGSVCVFTDVGTRLQTDGIGKIVRHFQNPNIGAVDGISTVDAEGHSNEGLYLKYENKIRDWEMNTCSMLGTGGCFFAARTSMLHDSVFLRNGTEYKGFVPDLQSDFRTGLVAKTFDLWTIIDEEAIALFKDGNEKKEGERKHRTIVRGINCFMNNLHLLNPFRYGLFSYALINHKLMKWLVPFFMLGALLSSLAGWVMYGSYIWFTLFVAQSLFYVLAIKNVYDKGLGKIAHFLVISNLAALRAWYSYVKGERYVYWESTKR